MVPAVAWWLANVAGAQSQPPVDVVAPYVVRLQVESDVLLLPYFRNYSLDRSNPGVTDAIVVIHGMNRNAYDYFNRVLIPARDSGMAQQHTAILAPQFLVEADVEAFDLQGNILYWSSSGWRQGNLSLNSNDNPRPAQLSSFAVMDSILWRLAVNNPMLQHIVVVGHSAGGQFVNRYAAGSPMPDSLEARYGLPVRFIVSNPSSYLYFNGERRIGFSLDRFAEPGEDERRRCPDYDDYRYGLQSLNTYMSAVGREAIRSQYARREVVYLLGGEDNDPNDPSLDRRCPAMLQGRFRLERGQIYYNYAGYYFGRTIYRRHSLAIVPGVGHSSAGIFASDCGKYFLFDYGACGTVSSVGHRVAGRSLHDFVLYQNYPNPVYLPQVSRAGNPDLRTRLFARAGAGITRIAYDLPVAAEVEIVLYDLTGWRVRTLVARQWQQTGAHTVVWDGADERGKLVASGIYVYVAEAGGFRKARRLLIVR